MKYRSDKYGNQISVLGYGCMRFTQKAGKIDVEKAENEIMTAYNAGVNYYDTAYIYPGSFVAIFTLSRILFFSNISPKAASLPGYMYAVS